MEPERRHVEGLARAGWIAKGVLYGTLGLLALAIALGVPAQDADQEGAFRTLAAQPFGGVLVAAMAAGLAGYALWRLAQAAWPRHASSDALWRRVVNAGRGLLYAGFSVLAVLVLVRARLQPDTEMRVTAAVLRWPGGVVLVAAVGAGLLGAGLYQGYVVVSGGLRDQLVGDRRPARRWLLPVGAAGFLARLVAFVLAGAFIVRAAVTFDPEQSRGLDGALQQVAQTGPGRWVIGLVGVGLVAYGVFCLALARVGQLRES
jgi:uncharacterized membrane protein (DUF485 family)